MIIKKPMSRSTVIRLVISAVIICVSLLGLFRVVDFDSDTIFIPMLALLGLNAALSVRKRTIVIKILQVMLLAVSLAGLYSIFFNISSAVSSIIKNVGFVVIMVSFVVVLISEIKIVKPEPTDPKSESGNHTV